MQRVALSLIYDSADPSGPAERLRSVDSVGDPSEGDYNELAAAHYDWERFLWR